MATYEKVSWFQRLKNDMKDMTFGEKLGHLWEYYKWVAIVGVILIVATVSVVLSVIQNTKELVYGGVVINLEVTEEGNAYLKEGWFEAQGADEKKQRIELDTVYISNLGSGTYSEISAASVTKLTTMVDMGEVDYVLTEVDAIGYLSDKGLFSALDTMFTPEQLAQFEGKMFQYADGDEQYWIAVDITELPFVKKHISLSYDGEENRVCIAFPGNTGRTEKNIAFLEYLMNWSE